MNGRETWQRIDIFLSDKELKAMCFDHHYELAGLDILMPLDRSITLLTNQRLQILVSNWNQANAYLNIRHVEEHLLLQSPVRPRSPEEPASALYAEERSQFSELALAA